MGPEFRALVVEATGLSANRVNWGQDPTELRGPYVTLHLIGETGGHHMQGPDRLFRSRVQVDCRAGDFATARGLADKITAAIDGRRDSTFCGIFFDGLRMTREGGADMGEAVYRASLDFLAHWRAENG